MLRAILASAFSISVSACSSAPHAPPAPIEESPAEMSSHSTSGETTGGFSSPVVLVPDGPPSTTDTSCALPPARRSSPDCSSLFPLKVSASGGTDSAERAFDGSTCTVWSSGGVAPQSITIDLGAATDVDALILVPEMGAGGTVSHRIEVSDDGVHFQTAQRIEAPMQNGLPVELDFPRREHTRFMRFTTDASPSRVAWREIELIRCGSKH